MSIDNIRWAFDTACAGTDRLVLLAMAYLAADGANTCWASVPTIARMVRRASGRRSAACAT